MIQVSGAILNGRADVEIADVSNHYQKWLNIFLHQVENRLPMFDYVHLANLAFLDLTAKTLCVLRASHVGILSSLLSIDFQSHHILDQFIFDESQLHVDTLGQLFKILILELFVNK